MRNEVTDCKCVLHETTINLLKLQVQALQREIRTLRNTIHQLETEGERL